MAARSEVGAKVMWFARIRDEYDGSRDSLVNEVVAESDRMVQLLRNGAVPGVGRRPPPPASSFDGVKIAALGPDGQSIRLTRRSRYKTPPAFQVQIVRS